MKRQLPSQTLEEQFRSPDTWQAPCSETIRLAAQLMVQKAVELEVTQFLGRDHYQRYGEGLLWGYRNGYADKRVQTAEGPIDLKMAQVRNTIDAFEGVWLQSLVRRSDKLAALIPQLYVKGMSTRDIEAPFTETGQNLHSNWLPEKWSAAPRAPKNFLRGQACCGKIAGQQKKGAFTYEEEPVQYRPAPLEPAFNPHNLRHRGSDAHGRWLAAGVRQTPTVPQSRPV